MKSNQAVIRSKELFDNGFGCAEAVLIAVSEHRQIRSELIPRIASGLCGGFGKTNGMCGAMSGGVLALSLVYGRDDTNQPKDILNEKIQKFVEFFRNKFGSINCTDLTGCDLSKPDGLQKFEAMNLHTKCLDFVVEATRKVISLIE